jgi:hypothetical protein
MTNSLDQIAEAAAAVEEAKNALYWSVQDAREDHTWQEIADVLGCSRQSAHERFAPALIDPSNGPRT